LIVDSTKAVLILSPCRHRSPKFGDPRLFAALRVSHGQSLFWQHVLLCFQENIRLGLPATPAQALAHITVTVLLGRDYAMWATITVKQKMRPTSHRNQWPTSNGITGPHRPEYALCFAHIIPNGTYNFERDIPGDNPACNTLP
jgi:hypothetical protein